VNPRRIDGVALALGTFAMLVTMAAHPRGGSGQSLRDGESLSRAGVAAVVSHSIGIAALPLLLVGFWGLSRRLGWESAPVRLAFAAYALATAAVLNAAVMSGFVATGVAMSIRPETAEVAKAVAALYAYTFVLNQGFAKVYVVASSAAIVLWSLRGIRLGGGWRAAGIFGLLAGAVPAAGVLASALPLNVHGFGIVVLVQAAWTLWIATRLMSDRAQATVQLSEP
jgi:uncharacterized membrane protein YvlD (DUF360 family)